MGRENTNCKSIKKSRGRSKNTSYIKNRTKNWNQFFLRDCESKNVIAKDCKEEMVKGRRLQLIDDIKVYNKYGATKRKNGGRVHWNTRY